MAKWAKFLPIIIIIVIIVIVIIVLTLGTRTYHPRKAGRWSDIKHSQCTNESGDCTQGGTREVYRECVYHSESESGCIDENGDHVFGKEILRIEPCFPMCIQAEWKDTTVSSDCRVFNDKAGTSLSTDQSCYNDGQYAYKKTTRTCVSNTNQGTNYCIRSDGSRAKVGETEIVVESCDGEIDHCILGEWQRCHTDPRETAVGIRSVPGATCGEIVQSGNNSTCTILNETTGVWETTTDDNCFENDKIECPEFSLNYPCVPHPPSYEATFENMRLQFRTTATDSFIPVYDANQQIIVDNGGIVEDSIATTFAVAAQEPITMIMLPSTQGMGRFYLLAHVENETSWKIMRHDGIGNLFMDHLPGNFTDFDSFDDEGIHDLFVFTGPSAGKWKLNHFIPPATLVDVFCGGGAECLFVDTFPI